MPIIADIDTVLSAARALADAGRHHDALALLDSLRVDDDHHRLAVLVAVTEVAAQRDWVLGRRSGDDPSLAEALTLAEELDAGGATTWDLAMLQLRREYADALVHPDGTLWLGPEGRDTAALEQLRERARRLDETAPDTGRRGWALMSRGLVADNLVGDRAASAGFYAEAVSLGEEAGDRKLVFDAQRHLGDHLRDRGDKAAVRAAWEESAGAAAAAGYVTGVLAQQVLLAELALEEGDDAGALALAAATGRWATAIGANRLAAEVESFLSGVAVA